MYLALNSLVKESELAQAYRAMMAAAEMEPDALIIQDPGLASLARSHCPSIPLHASTLTAVHNLDGLKALKFLGYSRAVLPREMTLKEIAELAPRSPLPLEIFVHGALCFSFSGLCLMSSFWGGDRPPGAPAPSLAAGTTKTPEGKEPSSPSQISRPRRSSQKSGSSPWRPSKSRAA